MEAGSSKGAIGTSGGAGGAGALAGGSGNGGQTSSKAGGGASDFVKKLYKMLEDPAFAHIVSWGRTGDSFVVKDMNDFTKLILPRHFKHSNFASFVRQLNKYDFHKVKNPEDGQGSYGEHTWEFRHPQFRADTQDSLDNIKRKAPAPKKSQIGLNQADGYGAVIPANGNGGLALGGGNFEGLQGQIDAMRQVQTAMNHQIFSLTREYQNMIGEMVSFRRNFVAHDQVMQNLIQYAIGLESDRRADPATPFVPSEQAQKLIASYHEVARASLEQMDEIARRGLPPGNQPQHSVQSLPYAQGGHRSSEAPPYAPNGMTGLPHHRPGDSTSSSPPSGGYDSPPSAGSYRYPSGQAEDFGYQQHTSQGQAWPQQHQQSHAPAQPHPSQQGQPAHADLPTSIPIPIALGDNSDGGLRVFTVGHLMPRQDEHTNEVPGQGAFGGATEQMPTLDKTTRTSDESREGSENAGLRTSTQGDKNPSPNPGADGGEAQANGKPMLRVRRGTYIPGWAVPPRVLLVEDDAVCRTLSSKFLQVFGCAIDVAVDGVTAVNKMNLEKFDLVLMDIVMPRLNGVSATAMIRQFDATTPIISMTSNAQPDDILTYFDHGMNDILPKPFTKEGLLTMLEKHLIHMKAIQQMAEVPRALGMPVEQAQQALQSLAAPGNPFVEMGITDENYQAMLNGIFQSVDGGSSGNKRPFEHGDGSESKRGRFEEVAAHDG